MEFDLLQVTFRYQTRLCDDDHTPVDDNRKDPKPLELIFGKKFKLEVWETCLKSMRANEVASFVVDVSVSAVISLMLVKSDLNLDVVAIIETAVRLQMLIAYFMLNCNI